MGPGSRPASSPQTGSGRPAPPRTPPRPPGRHPPGRPRTSCSSKASDPAASPPQDGAEDSYTLTLEHGLGQTLYFSDRPDRIVGASPTADFLKGLPFGPNNPPNAALVIEAAPGETDVVVVELTTPTYDEATHTATYEAKVLSDFQQLGITVQEAPKGATEVTPAFGAASLFIDDCPDATLICKAWNGSGSRSAPIGQCWRHASCEVCYPPSGEQTWGDLCAQKFPDFCGSNGGCQGSPAY